MRASVLAIDGGSINGNHDMMQAGEVSRTPYVWGWLSQLLLCLLVLGIGNALAAQGPSGGGGGVRAFGPAPVRAAAPVPPQFDITGFIQEATLDTDGTICQASDPRLAGGTLRVNSIKVVVPCNTVLQMPAATLTWQELFSLAPRDIGLALDANGIPVQTGLALADTVTVPLAAHYSNGRLPSYEVHVQGNIVDGRYIAGLIFISQQNLNIGQGTITAIDYHNGELLINSGGATPSTARVKINDPIGRFGLSHGAPGSGAPLIEPAYDQRFAIDVESPTIHAATGFPMCIPRGDPIADGDDPLCPRANRPRSPDCTSLPSPFPAFTMPPSGQVCTSFMMPPPPRNSCTSSKSYSCPPDPTQQAPFEVGDFIDFSGTLKYDSKGPYISAHTIVDHVGIYTTPGIMPAYVAIEMELQGTAALPFANLHQEVTSRVKVEGFSTDPSNLVDIYAVDIDPVTGVAKDRLLGIANPSGPPVIGRFRFKPAAGAFLPPPREFRVVSRTLCGDPTQPCRMPSAPRIYANGLIAGQYHAPNFEFIFGENLIQGDAVVSANFQDFVFLFCGSGPLTTPTVGTMPPRVGQLDPAPWAEPMPDPMFALTLCPTEKRVDGSGTVVAPLLATIARAVATPVSAATGQIITLSDVTSSDPNTPVLSLSDQWTQTGGPVVVLSDSVTGPPSFTAPAVVPATNLTSGVAAKNTVPLTTYAEVPVTVNPSSPPPSLTFNAPASAVPGSLVTMIGTVFSGSTFTSIQTAGQLVTLNGADTLTPSFSELLITSEGPTPSTARVEINDPIGRFGLSRAAPGSGEPLIEPSYDQRFAIDVESPTIHAARGGPMCIPRGDPIADGDDPLCPRANRPPPSRNSCTSSKSYTCPPDPTQQAPLEVGEFIDSSGTLKYDSKGPYISAHTIVDHVGIYTTPGIMPAYVATEMKLQGTAALPFANLQQEVTSRVKVEGFSTDPNNLVNIYAVDIDPVTGAAKDRLLGIANPSGPPVIGRFGFKPAAGAFLPPPAGISGGFADPVR